MNEERCRRTFRLPKYAGEPRDVVCNRLMTDQCASCVVFDKHKDEWYAVFNEYRDEPRVAVDGDIL